jgi:Family of unknown function (DUF6104)
VYFTDRGISELAERRGHEDVTLAWLAEKLSEFVDIHPEHEATIDQLATWLARADDDLDLRERRALSHPSLRHLTSRPMIVLPW